VTDQLEDLFADLRAGTTLNDSVATTPVAEGTGWLTATQETSMRPGDQVVPQAGRYLLFVACASDHPVELVVDLSRDGDQTPLASQTVQCFGTTPSQPTRQALHLPDQHLKSITIRVASVGRPSGQIGYAYKLVSDLPDTAPAPSGTTTANATRALARLMAGWPEYAPQAVTSEVDRSVWVGRLDSETADLRLACAGPGTVRVVAIRVGPDATPDGPLVGDLITDYTMHCTAAGLTATVPMKITGKTGVRAQLYPDPDARNRAGYAVGIGVK
jgi:hypothetical protein